MGFRNLWIALALAVLPAEPLQAAVVHLKGGTSVQGSILSRDAQEIVVLSGTSGRTHIPMTLVQSVEEDAAPAPAPAAAPASAPPPERVIVYRRRRRWRRVPAPPPLSFDESRNELSFNLGFDVPLSDIDLSPVGGSDTNGGAGLSTGLRYLYYASPHWGFGLDFGYVDRGATDSFNMIPSADTSVSGDSLVFLVLAKYRFYPEGWMRPYVLAGVGTHRTSTVIQAQPVPGSVWSDTFTGETRTLVDERRWGVAETGRFGLEFHAFDPCFTSVELGWLGLESDRLAPTGAGTALGLGSVRGRSDAFIANLRVGWKF